MNSIKTANILLIAILVIIIATNVWSIVFVKNVADEKEKGTTGTDGTVSGFLGTRTLARKIVKKSHCKN